MNNSIGPNVNKFSPKEQQNSIKEETELSDFQTCTEKFDVGSDNLTAFRSCALKKVGEDKAIMPSNVNFESGSKQSNQVNQMCNSLNEETNQWFGNIEQNGFHSYFRQNFSEQVSEHEVQDDDSLSQTFSQNEEDKKSVKSKHLTSEGQTNVMSADQEELDSKPSSIRSISPVVNEQQIILIPDTYEVYENGVFVHKQVIKSSNSTSLEANMLEFLMEKQKMLQELSEYNLEFVKNGGVVTKTTSNGEVTTTTKVIKTTTSSGINEDRSEHIDFEKEKESM